MIRETNDNKPYTEYLIEIQYLNQKYELTKKYKQFFELHQEITNAFPNVQIASASSLVVNTDLKLICSRKKPLIIEERRKNL